MPTNKNKDYKIKYNIPTNKYKDRDEKPKYTKYNKSDDLIPYINAESRDYNGYENVPPNIRHKIENYESNQGDRRSANVRGWHIMQPRKVDDRRKLLSVCGPKCYLEPNEKVPKYPICSRVMGDRYDCKISRKGLIAAQRRAHINAVHQIPNAANVEQRAIYMLKNHQYEVD